MMKWSLEAQTRKYATFEGRARRSEYWYFVLRVFTVLDSQPGANRFGPNPKEEIGSGAAA